MLAPALERFVNVGEPQMITSLIAPGDLIKSSQVSALCSASTPTYQTRCEPSNLNKLSSRSTQKQTAEEFQNLSTVSTLLSAVTAAALAYTVDVRENTAAYRANLLWVISVIFSTASAIQAQLAFYWLRHPRHEESPVVFTGSRIILASPLALFVVAIITFLGGLISFTFALYKGTALPPFAVICASIALVAMGVSSYWRVLEASLSFKESVKWENLKPQLSSIRSLFLEGAKIAFRYVSALLPKLASRFHSPFATPVRPAAPAPTAPPAFPVADVEAYLCQFNTSFLLST